MAELQLCVSVLVTSFLCAWLHHRLALAPELGRVPELSLKTAQDPWISTNRLTRCFKPAGKFKKRSHK